MISVGLKGGRKCGRLIGILDNESTYSRPEDGMIASIPRMLPVVYIISSLFFTVAPARVASVDFN